MSTSTITATAATIDIESIIENPLESGPILRSSFTANDQDFNLPEFDSLQDAVFAFHRFGHSHRLADPDGAFGTVFLTDDDSAEITLRFDAMGAVFME